MKELFVSLVLLSVVLMTAANFISSCEYKAQNEADCRNSGLKEIPKNLSSETQILDLSENNLNKIPSFVFRNMTLNDLKKIYMKECNLVAIEKNGLSGLPALYYLDLSHNNIVMLDTDTFKDVVKIKYIILEYNQIQSLENGLFNNLTFLDYVDLSDNKIKRIGERTFTNVPNLKTLLLDSNKLENLKIGTLSGLTANIALGANPWRCDCELSPLINWAISERQVTDLALLECKTKEFYNKLWIQLRLNCPAPQIHNTATSIMIHTSSLVLLLLFSFIDFIY